MTIGTYKVEVDWANDGSFATAGDDITASVIEITTFSGRSQLSQLTGRAEAGTAEIIVRNQNGLFSPLHINFLGATGSTTALPIRVRTTAPTAATLWQGFVDDIGPYASRQGIPESRITAKGPLLDIAARTANCAPSTSGATIDVQVGVILDAIDWPVGLRDISPCSVTTGWWICDRENALDALRKLESTELGFLGETAAGVIFFNHRYYRRDTARCNTSQGTFTDASSTLGYQAIRMGSLANMRQEQYDHVTAHVTSSRIGEESMVWFSNTINLGLPIVPPGEFRDVTALLPWELQPDRFSKPFDGHPFAAEWTQIVCVASSNVGDLFDPALVTAAVVGTSATTATIRVTNANTDGYAAYYLQVYATPVFLDDPVEIPGGTGHRDYPFPGNWFRSEADGQSAIAWILDHHTLPRAQLSIELLANKNATMFAQCVQRAISDQITVTATGTRTELSSNATPVYIEAIHHHIHTNGGIHEVTFDCSAVDPITPSATVYARWDVTNWDQCVWA